MAHFRSSAGSAGRLKSYTAVGWHAQVRKLAEAGERGSAAADAVGLDPTARTLKGWLSDPLNEPTKANQAKIHAAYDRLAGKFPEGVKGETLKITGVVGYGDDVRERGGNSGAPLKVNGSKGKWDRIEEAWNDGTLDEALLEDLYAEDVIGEDIGDNYEWSFPGGSYSVAA